MIKLLNEQKEQVALLTDVTDLKVVKDLNSIEQIEFNFTASSDYRHELKCERYLIIQNFSNEYVIKEVNDNGYSMQVIAICNIEDLQGNAFKQFTSLEQNINNTLLAALNGSGWTFELHCNTKKRRTLRKKITNSYDILDDIKKLFRIEYKFDALNKKLYVYDQRGSDRGSYFMSDLNLVSLTKEGHTYDLITRIYPIGKDDLTIESVNNGKDYVENLSFKNKVIAAYWKDERYTDKESLRDDAILKLNDLSKPYVSYKAVVKDLAAINGTDIHMYDIGDTVTIVDKKTRTRETQRIVKLTVYPKDPDNNTCEIASHALTFEDLQAEKDSILNLAGDTIGTDGTISTDDLNGSIEVDDNSITGDKIKVEEISSQHIKADSIQTHHLSANSINADKIQSNSINTGHLTAGSVTADKISSNSINSGHIVAGSIEAGHINSSAIEGQHIKGNVIEGHHIKGDVITGNHIQSDSIKTEHLSAGSVTAKEIAAGTITAGSGIIADGAIGSAQISELNASKITSGTIDTSKITVAGPNNNLKMSGNRLQVFTGTGSGQVERVSLGDVNGDGSKYGLLIRGADGKTVIMDENGVTNAGITNGSITNEKISGNANIDGAKLNINSVVTKINGATESISGTKIDINGTNLSTKLSQQDTTITDQGKKIAANTSSITANTNAIKLKVDSQTYTTDKQNINTTLSKHTSEISAMKDSIALKVEQSDIETAKSQLQSSIDTANNNISAAQKDISTIKNNVAAINVDLNGITQRVSSTESTTTTLTQKVNTAQSTADTAKANAATAQSTANSAKTAASTAQSTADSKAKVFTSTPTVPYKVGDLWTGGPSGDVMRCKTARSSGSYTASDWEKASKYTDDTTANAAKTAASNAQSTANTANATANANKTEIASTKSKVATIETNLDSITQRVSSTESTLKTTTTTANNANTAINNLTIGGRNLLKGTSKEIKQVTFGGWDYYFPNNLTTWIAGEQLTGRIYLKPTNQEASCMIHVRYTDSTYKQYRGNIIKAGQEGYSTATITVPTDKTISHIQFSIRHSASSTPTDTVSYKEAKVEKGNKATDWTPAPEDVDSSISAVDSKVESTKSKVSSIETNLSGITSRVSSVETAQSTTNGKVSSLESRMSTAEQKITSDAIVSTVTGSTTYKNAMTGKVDKTQIISTINQTAESVKINASKIQLTGDVVCNAVNSGSTTISGSKITTGTISADKIAAGAITADKITISPAANNLLKNGAFLYSTTANPPAFWSAWGTCSRAFNTITGKTWLNIYKSDTQTYRGISQVTDPGSYSTNTKYTISLLAMPYSSSYYNKGVKIGVHLLDANNNILEQYWNTESQCSVGNSTTTPRLIKFTFTTGSNTSGVKFNVMIGGCQGANFDYRITDISMVKGDYAMQWTPHISEVYSSKVNITDNGMTIKNNAGSTVMSADSSGNLQLSGDFTIGTSSGTNKALHTANYSRWNHTDGSYTQISSSGLQKFVAGTGRNYHYLMETGKVRLGRDNPSSYPAQIDIQLPSAFIGKDFKVFLSVGWISRVLGGSRSCYFTGLTTNYTIISGTTLRLYGAASYRPLDNEYDLIEGFIDVIYTIIA